MKKNRKNNIRWILSIAILAAALLCMILKRPEGTYLKEQVIEGSSNAEDSITFRADLSSVTAIALSLEDTPQEDMDSSMEGSMDESIDSSIDLVITGDDGTLFQQSFAPSDAGYFTFGDTIPPETPLSLVHGQTYQVETAINGAKTSAVSIALYGDAASPMPWYVLLCSALLVLLVLVLLFPERMISHPKTTLVVSLMVLGVLNTLILTPFHTPDEKTHFLNTSYLAGKLTGKVEEDGLVHIRESGLVRMLEDTTPSGSADLTDTIHFLTDTKSGNQVLENSPVAAGPTNIPSYCYLPGALGLMLGQALRLPYQGILLLGRFTNLLFFALIAALSMALCPNIQYLIAGTCLFPGIVRLCTSYSYDVWNLALAFLFLSLCLHDREREQKMRILDVALLGSVFIALVPVKFVYVFLGLGIFLIPRNKWSKKPVIFLLSAAALACIAILAFRGREILDYLSTSSMDASRIQYIESIPGIEFYTVDYILHHPGYVALVFLKTAATQTRDLFSSAVFGYLFNNAPGLVKLAGYLLIAALYLTAAEELSLKKKDRILSLVIFLLGSLAIYATFLFSWSYIPAEGIGVIAGMQGRYFVPLMPLLGLSFCLPKRAKKLRALSAKLRLPEITLPAFLVLNAATLYFLMASLLQL